MFKLIGKTSDGKLETESFSSVCDALQEGKKFIEYCVITGESEVLLAFCTMHGAAKLIEEANNDKRRDFRET